MNKLIKKLIKLGFKYNIRILENSKIISDCDLTQTDYPKRLIDETIENMAFKIAKKMLEDGLFEIIETKANKVSGTMYKIKTYVLKD